MPRTERRGALALTATSMEGSPNHCFRKLLIHGMNLSARFSNRIAMVGLPSLERVAKLRGSDLQQQRAGGLGSPVNHQTPSTLIEGVSTIWKLYAITAAAGRSCFQFGIARAIWRATARSRA